MQTWPEGTDRIFLSSTDSTNSEAARLVGKTRQPFWLMAEEQTEGRGRYGREWVSRRGNLFATYTRRVREDPAISPRRSFVASLALRDCLLSLFGDRIEILLKWPNDVIVGGGKAAGILLERIRHGNSDYVLHGFGVNLASKPDIANRSSNSPSPVSLFDIAQRKVDPKECLNVLANSLSSRERQYESSGFQSIRKDWLGLAFRLGKIVSIESSDGVLLGEFKDIDQNGCLVLATKDGTCLLTSGDLQFQRTI